MKKLNDMIIKMLANGDDLETIRAAVKTYFKRNFTIEEFKLYVLEQIGLSSNLSTLSASEREAVAEVFRMVETQYANTTRGVQKRVVNIVSNGLKNDLSQKDIRDALNSTAAGYSHYSQTIARTAQRGFDSYMQFSDYDENEKFKYIGVSAERPFCRSMLSRANAGETFTKSEIMQMDNRQGLNCFYYMGGWNCRHKWRPV